MKHKTLVILLVIEFVLCKELMLDMRLNMEESELSISSVCEYIEKHEVY